MRPRSLCASLSDTQHNFFVCLSLTHNTISLCVSLWHTTQSLCVSLSVCPSLTHNTISLCVFLCVSLSDTQHNLFVCLSLCVSLWHTTQSLSREPMVQIYKSWATHIHIHIHIHTHYFSLTRRERKCVFVRKSVCSWEKVCVRERKCVFVRESVCENTCERKIVCFLSLTHTLSVMGWLRLVGAIKV